MKILRKKQHIPDRRRNLAHEGQGRAVPVDIDQRYAFRRNRTLTGSLSSAVTSVNEHRAELKSSRVQAHDLRHRRRHLAGLLALIVAVCIVLGWILYQSIAIPQVVANGVRQPIDQKYYASKIQDYLNGHFFERSRLTLNTQNLAAYLQANGCPEVASVDSQTRFSGLGAAQVTLTMRRPAISWSSAGQRLYVDGDGNAFTKNYYAEPSVEVVDQTGIQAKDNQVLVSNRFLGFVGKVIGRFAAQQRVVTKVILPASTTHQIVVELQDVKPQIKLSIDRPAGEQVEDAVRSIAYLSAKGIEAQYIDVRISGKAYYK